VNHLSPEELADVDAVADHEHLRACERCRGEWEQQRAVRDLLRGLPDPGALPPDVAADLSSALGRLSPADVEGPGTDSVSRAAATVVPLSPPPARRDPADRARPWLAVAAAVVLIGGGGAALVTQPWSGGGQAASDSAAGGVSAEKSARGDASLEAAGTPVYATGTRYTRAALPAQVEQHLLQGSPSPLSGQPAPAAGEGSAPQDTRLATPEGLASCLSALDVDAGHVTAVDLAEFQGDPAALVVVRDDASGHDVWVVGRGCRQGDDQTRYFARVG
jgi:hypothetical protein